MKIKAQDPAFVHKIIETKRLRGTLNTSSEEDEFFEFAKNIFPNIMRQYSGDKRYPHACDLYDPDNDLFIECNFHWTHGPRGAHEPYDPDNLKHQELLATAQEKARTSKFWKVMVKLWTRSDVEKRATAKRNDLNFLEFYNLEEAKELLSQIWL